MRPGDTCGTTRDAVRRAWQLHPGRGRATSKVSISAGAMSKPADNPADPFKKALAEATRAMAGEPELTVAYSVDPPGCAAGNMRLPQVTRRLTRDEVMLARGTADAYALRLRYHDDATHRRYAPEGETAVALFEAMETARCEAVGARAMPGTAGNIDAKIADEARRLGYAEISDPGRAPLAQAAGYLVRHLATGRKLPAGAQNVMELWRGFLDSHAGGTLKGLDAVLDDQQAFARFARRVIEDLGYGDQLGDDPDAADEPDEEDGDDAAPEEQESGGEAENDSQEDAAQEDAPSDERTDPQDMQAALEAADDSDLAEEMDVEDSEAPERRPPPPYSEADPGYKVFVDQVRRGDRRRGSRRPGRARAAARLPRPAARALEGRGRAAGQPAAAPAAGAAEPRLGLRPRGGHARRRPARPRRRQPDDAALASRWSATPSSATPS